jgi:hypothetical protein
MIRSHEKKDKEGLRQAILLDISVAAQAIREARGLAGDWD